MNSLLGKISTDKYRVTITDVINAVKDRISADDMLTLFKFIVFSVIISHGDLHAKNLSLVYCSNEFSDKDMALAPMYDILTTNIYAATQNTKDIGMKLNNKTSNIRTSDLLVMSSLMSIKEETAKSIIDHFSSKFLSSFEDHINLLPDNIKTLPVKRGDYSNDITLHKVYILYYQRRKAYIENYLIEHVPEKNIFL